MGGGGGFGFGLLGAAVGLFVLAESYDLLRHNIYGSKKAPYPKQHKIVPIGIGPRVYFGDINSKKGKKANFGVRSSYDLAYKPIKIKI